MTKNTNTARLVLLAILSAVIVVFTVVPYFGYINYGLIEITTIHIVVILGATILGVKNGGVLGLVWGVTCMIRAFTNPLWIAFTNPLISVLPRILVGIIAGAIFKALSRTSISDVLKAGITACIGTLSNTVLVLGSYYIFGGMFESYKAVYDLFKTIITTLIGINGVIELIGAIVLVPILYKTVKKAARV